MELSIIQKIAIWVLPVLFAITLHEVAHGWVASFFGDQTARLSGRLTLNPIKHIDLVGTILVPLLLLTFSNFIFGWAKPVPVDARNMRHPKRDMAIVSAAGPAANFLMAIAWAAIAKLGLYLLAQNNFYLGLPLAYMGKAGVLINIVLGILNCLPIPPLDGGRFLLNILPGRWGWHLSKLEPYSFLILILLMLTGILFYIITPPILLLLQFILTLFNLPPNFFG